MKKYECQKCGAKVELPDEVPRHVRSEVQRIAEQSRIDAMMYLRNQTELDLARSKAVSFHLANANGGCHRCGTTLPVGDEVGCEKCKSFNLNW
jgi:DNA-directed RNA polymerase subunit RPC12/RpoP